MPTVCACLDRSAKLECPDCPKFDITIDPKDMPDKNGMRRRGLWLLPVQVQCPHDVPAGTVMRVFPNRDNAVSASAAVKVLMSGFSFGSSAGTRRILVRIRRPTETGTSEKVGSCQFFRGRPSIGGGGAKAVRCPEGVDLAPGEGTSRTLELVGAALPPTLAVGQWVSVELNYPMIIEVRL